MNNSCTYSTQGELICGANSLLKEPAKVRAESSTFKPVTEWRNERHGPANYDSSDLYKMGGGVKCGGKHENEWHMNGNERRGESIEEFRSSGRSVPMVSRSSGNCTRGRKPNGQCV